MLDARPPLQQHAADDVPQATVYYSFEYGHDAASKRRGSASTAGRSGATRSASRRSGRCRCRAASRRRPLIDSLARPGRPGGIDFSSLELRYVSDKGPKGGGISYSLARAPDRGPSESRRRARGGEALLGRVLRLARAARDLVLGQPQAHSRRTQIIDPQFARTDAGHVLLDADLRLKRRDLWPLHASRTRPPAPSSGAELDALYGNDAFEDRTHCAGVPGTWIEPAPATVRETAGELHILDAPLAVKLEAIDAGRRASRATAARRTNPACPTRRRCRQFYGRRAATRDVARR